MNLEESMKSDKYFKDDSIYMIKKEFIVKEKFE